MYRFFKHLIYCGPFFAPDDNGGGGGAADDEAAKKAKADADAKAEEQRVRDQQFADRAKRAEEATKAKLFADLGVKDETEYQAFLKNKKEAEDKNKSETDKLAEQARLEKERADKLEADAKTEREALQKRVLDTEIKISAVAPVKDKDGKVVRPAFRPEAIDDVLLVIKREAITEKEGKYEGIEKALADLAKAKPWLLAEESKVTPKRGTPGERDGKQKSGTSSDEPRDRIITSL